MVRAAMGLKTIGIVLSVLLVSGCASFPAERTTGERSTSGAAEPYGASERQEGTETAAYTPTDPESLQRDYPRRIDAVSGPAVVSLYRQAGSELEAGRLEAAEAVLERALRIEPRNPFVWTKLAEVQLEAGQARQAGNTAQRAIGLVRGNPYLEARNWTVIAGARRSEGNGAAAEAAAEKAEQARLRQSADG